jgi:signal-transduction protein with cAMP-binding, CBS, and nucleotidyltransferase domain
MQVDKQIFDLVERIGRLMRDLEFADTASETGTPIAIAMANEAWRKASRELNETTQALAALEPESFPAMAAIADAAALTGSPTLIAALRDALLRLAVRQAEAHELRRDRIENEPPIGRLEGAR